MENLLDLRLYQLIRRKGLQMIKDKDNLNKICDLDHFDGICPFHIHLNQQLPFKN